LVTFTASHKISVGACNSKKDEVHPRTGHEGLEGGRGVALLFL
jgi:hypothetical protein